MTDRGITTDRATIVGQLSGLYADGGDDCPENVLGGTASGLSALNRLEDFQNVPKDLIVVTDASAQPGNVDAIISEANASAARVNVVLTGNCGLATAASTTLKAASTQLTAQELSSYTALKRIADETGGSFYYMPGATDEDYKRVILSMLQNVSNPKPADTTPPTLSLSVTPTTIWPPNHKMIPVDVTVKVSDDTDPNPTVKLIGVGSSESDNGQGDGNTTQDVQITSDGKISVRAERSGKAGTRTYTITYRAVDAAGDETYATADVTVGKK